MANLIDSQMSLGNQKIAKKILFEVGYDDLKVIYDEAHSEFVFSLDRRVVKIPMHLVQDNLWSDIRHLFRSVLDSENQLWNHSADHNDWTTHNHYGYEKK